MDYTNDIYIFYAYRKTPTSFWSWEYLACLFWRNENGTSKDFHLYHHYRTMQLSLN